MSRSYENHSITACNVGNPVMSLSLYFKHIRCPKTTVDPERGVKDGHEPLETLRK